jgi:uncharacterized protein (DUF2235 family)
MGQPMGERVPDGKNIALFLDGTWNTVDDDTNVWRLKSLCSLEGNQVLYYSTGVGTTFGQHIMGGMFGYGLDDEVIRAYQWLIENYNPGDRLFIFGFSRGAFTARSLAGFISKCGLLKPGAPISLRQLYERYRKGKAAHTIRELNNIPEAQLSLEDGWIKKYSMPIPIWFQGVWDTVGALGIPFGSLPRVSQSNYAFLETDLRINNDRAFHALAIDEHRYAFAPTLWTTTVAKDTQSYVPRPLSDVEQRWFIGAHADVGGGYDNGLLAQLPLKWLMQKAQLHGLIFKATVSIDGDVSRAAVHDSFAEMGGGVYRALKFGRPYYRPVGAAPSVRSDSITTTINETIDGSVFERWRMDSNYRPRNLEVWARSQQVSLDSLHVSVRADEPKEMSA